MTFKDEMKAAGKQAPDSAAGTGADSGDIAKLLRALNEDLKADPAEDGIAELDDGTALATERHLPLGKIVAALVAAAGVGFAVVMLDQDGNTPPPPPAPLIAAAPSAPAIATPGQTPAQGGASTVTIATAAPATVAPVPGTPAPATPAPTTRTPAPASTVTVPMPPAAALPQTPPPALKVPEPPPVALPAPSTGPKPAPVESTVKLPEVPPPSIAAPEPAMAEPAPTAKPEAPKAAPPQPEPAKAAPAPSKSPAETAELQAMLAPKPPARPAAEATRPAAPKATKPQLEPSRPAPAASAPVPTVPNGRYAIQLGTFQVAENADALVRRLRDSGFNAYALDWTDGEQKSWRAVRVGAYGDSTAAKRAADSLKAKMGLQPIVVGTH